MNFYKDDTKSIILEDGNYNMQKFEITKNQLEVYYENHPEELGEINVIIIGESEAKYA